MKKEKKPSRMLTQDALESTPPENREGVLQEESGALEGQTAHGGGERRIGDRQHGATIHSTENQAYADGAPHPEARHAANQTVPAQKPPRRA